MRPDVDRYQGFYASDLGTAVARLITNRLQNLCTIRPGDRIGYLGYGVPYVDLALQHQAEPLLFMPGAQGAHSWKLHPATNQHAGREGGRVAMVDDAHLPLADCSLDSIVLVHALEHVSRPNRFFRELWRVLKPSGHLAIIVPNRRSSWSAFETTPFAYGRPWSKSQLRVFMQDHLFRPVAAQSALMMPPFVVSALPSAMDIMEKPLLRINAGLGGVLVMIGDKEMIGGASVKEKKRERAHAAAQSSTLRPRAMDD